MILNVTGKGFMCLYHSMALKTNHFRIFCLILLNVCASEATFADFGSLNGRLHEPTCVEIPKNMTLCSDIGYDKMRLPNLLNHDTLMEVQQQSGSWVPLLNVRCHPHTKVFLCSLFTPVCLENQIFPCRSLCQDVQKNCEGRMATYGYHWPDMLNCENFPKDNDMCIKAPESEKSLVPLETPTNESDCMACNPIDTYENVLDNFCRADVVLRSRIKRKRGKKASLRKTKIIKSSDSLKKTRKIKKLVLEKDSSCCEFPGGPQKYLIMGVKDRKSLRPVFVLQWNKSKSLQKAMNVFRNLDCNDPNLFSPTADDGTILPKIEPTESPKKKGKGRKHRKGKNNKSRRNKKRQQKEGSEKKINKNKRRRNKNRRNDTIDSSN